jgi:D-alanine-D-alanine ligase
LFSPNQLTIGVLCGGRSSEKAISKRSGRGVASALKAAGFHVVMIDPADPSKMQERLRRIDIAFIALHGAGGEDGSIQRFLQRKKIPFIGSDPLGSMNAFDKEKTKRLLERANLPTADYTVVTERDWRCAQGGL